MLLDIFLKNKNMVNCKLILSNFWHQKSAWNVMDHFCVNSSDNSDSTISIEVIWKLQTWPTLPLFLASLEGLATLDLNASVVFKLQPLRILDYRAHYGQQSSNKGIFHTFSHHLLHLRFFEMESFLFLIFTAFSQY